MRRYGRIAKGDSVCPTKMVAAAHSDSTVRVPMIQRSAPPIRRTIHCMMPRWYRMLIRAAKKIMTGST